MSVADVRGLERIVDDPLPHYHELFLQLEGGRRADPSIAELVEDAARVWCRPGFDTLMSLPWLRFEPFEHQVATVRTVLQRMRGRAILADEVGLGKTIEAGLVLRELRQRGLADRVLVVVPAGLVGQWQEELERKFALPSAVATSRWSPDEASDAERPVLIASIAAARREPLRSALAGRDWDLVVVDEAHRVRSPRSASGRLVRALRSRYLLLLTATPVENRVDDLFQLVSLVAPGLLGTAAEFRKSHAAGATLRNVELLQRRTREVMVRHRRSEVALMLPRRLAETVKVTPGDDERQLYAELAARLRAEGSTAPPARTMTLRTLARLAGSSPAAVAPSLVKAGWPDLAEQAASVLNPRKEQVLVERIHRHLGRGEKVMVFTGFTATLHRLQLACERAGIPSATYHGSLTRQAKDAAIAAFADSVPVLLSTEAAGEGRNLQFCHAMVNVDLPWNPMQIEQRLGRLHRIGQTEDVVLTNLVGVGTIEERILQVLESKINLFELVVGELDMILGRIEEDFDFEAAVFRAFVSSADDAQFDAGLATVGESLARARTAYHTTRESTDALVGAEDGAG